MLLQNGYFLTTSAFKLNNEKSTKRFATSTNWNTIDIDKRENRWKSRRIYRSYQRPLAFGVKYYIIKRRAITIVSLVVIFVYYNNKDPNKKTKSIMQIKQKYKCGNPSPSFGALINYKLHHFNLKTPQNQRFNEALVFLLILIYSFGFIIWNFFNYLS